MDERSELPSPAETAALDASPAPKKAARKRAAKKVAATAAAPMPAQMELTDEADSHHAPAPQPPAESLAPSAEPRSTRKKRVARKIARPQDADLDEDAPAFEAHRPTPPPVERPSPKAEEAPAAERPAPAPAAPRVLIRPPVTREAVPTSYSSDADDWQAPAPTDEREERDERPSPAADRPAREERPERDERPRRDERDERNERDDRDPRDERDVRDQRDERPERPNEGQRGDRRDRRDDRGPQNQGNRQDFDRDRRQDRPDKFNRPEKFDRPNQGGGQQGQRPDKGNQGQKGFYKQGGGNGYGNQPKGGQNQGGGNQKSFNTQGGGNGNGGGGNNNPKPQKFADKKAMKQQRKAAVKERKRDAGFFGAETTFAIEVGELNNMPFFRDTDRLAEVAAGARDDAQEPLSFNQLLEFTLPQLQAVAREQFQLQPETNLARNILTTDILWQAWKQKRAIIAEGIVETTEDGYGLLVYEAESYRVKPLNAFIPRTLMKKFSLQRGMPIKVQLHPPRLPLPDDALEQLRDAGEAIEEAAREEHGQYYRGDLSPEEWEDELSEQAMEAIFPIAEYLPGIDAEEETCPYVLEITHILGHPAAEAPQLTPFEDLVPYYPTERIILENDEAKKWDNFSLRIVDLLTPIGLGQRGLIVAPPRTGKTILQQGIANSILKNMPKAHLIILLIDERPEEVTDFRRQIKVGEVIASTFDETPENHVHCAEMVIEKARRMVEAGRDVIILLDSITRLARAYNALAANSGKILSGGVEATALQKPKRFFGSARNIEGGGSLTIIGTALVETGSRMDEVIFEEFKGTGNMELHLDRQLSDKRIFPAIEMNKSGTRKEELLYHPDEMVKVHSLRRAMKGIPGTDAMEMLIARIKKTQTNVQFLMGING